MDNKRWTDAVVLPGPEPERIIRTLAAVERPLTVEGGLVRCVLCDAFLDGDDHETDCPWRLAKKWVAANPGR